MKKRSRHYLPYYWTMRLATLHISILVQILQKNLTLWLGYLLTTKTPLLLGLRFCGFCSIPWDSAKIQRHSCQCVYFSCWTKKEPFFALNKGVVVGLGWQNDVGEELRSLSALGFCSLGSIPGQLVVLMVVVR